MSSLHITLQVTGRSVISVVNMVPTIHHDRYRRHVIQEGSTTDALWGTPSTFVYLNRTCHFNKNDAGEFNYIH